MANRREDPRGLLHRLEPRQVDAHTLAQLRRDLQRTQAKLNAIRHQLNALEPTPTPAAVAQWEAEPIHARPLTPTERAALGTLAHHSRPGSH